MGGMSNPLTPEKRQELMAQVNDLSTKLILQSAPHGLPPTLLAAQTLIAFRAAGAGMTLQDLMDNLLANMPTMYQAALEAEEKPSIQPVKLEKVP